MRNDVNIMDLITGLLGLGAFVLIRKKHSKKGKESKKNDAVPKQIGPTPMTNDATPQETWPRQTSTAAKEANQYLHPKLFDEISLIWRESAVPLKIRVADVKTIFGLILARSINDQMNSEFLLNASYTPFFGLRFFTDKCKFVGALRFDVSGNIFDVILTAHGNKLLDKREKKYLGKWKAKPIGLSGRFRVNFAIFTSQNGKVRKGIYLNLSDVVQHLHQDAKKVYWQNLPLLSAAITCCLDETLPRVLVDVVMSYAIEAQTETEITAILEDFLSTSKRC